MKKIGKLTDDLAILQKLGDNPNTDNGMTATELKAAFDKAPLIIQQFINSVLVAAVNGMMDEYLPHSGGVVEGILTLQGPLILTEDIHYGTEEPTAGVEGQLFLVEITE